jgi:hypothetical protein
MAVEQAVEQAGVGGQVPEAQCCGNGPILSHQHTREPREEWAQQQHQKVKVEHAG